MDYKVKYATCLEVLGPEYSVGDSMRHATESNFNVEKRCIECQKVSVNSVMCIMNW